MMKNLFLSIVAALSLLSCGNKTEKGSLEPDEQAGSTAIESTDPKRKVNLNNGKKWQANPETVQGIGNMKRLTREFSSDAELADYTLLSERLGAEFALILQQCTMKGSAHENFHSYLEPMQAIIDSIGSDDLATAKLSVPELAAYLDKFNMYFE
jgi:hypothetical protein